ncbi:unnamed protein product [Amoebophrya sp. A25]|nr:unnamed protein product [Amoebophrya sp. A25]|eukprot:GSA25T00006265001.1
MKGTKPQGSSYLTTTTICLLKFILCLCRLALVTGQGRHR